MLKLSFYTLLSTSRVSLLFLFVVCFCFFHFIIYFVFFWFVVIFLWYKIFVWISILSCLDVALLWIGAVLTTTQALTTPSFKNGGRLLIASAVAGSHQSITSFSLTSQLNFKIIFQSGWQKAAVCMRIASPSRRRTCHTSIISAPHQPRSTFRSTLRDANSLAPLVGESHRWLTVLLLGVVVTLPLPFFSFTGHI